MDDSEGFRIVPNVDYTKVGPLNHKRTLAFLNHFITHTVRFLNRFSCVCEEKLSVLSGRIQRIEIMMNILEAKLSSIPGLEDVQAPAAASQPASQPVAAAPSTPASAAAAAAPATESGPPAPPPEPEPEPEAPTMTVSKDPRYAKYFQMVKVGVPAGALRSKMAAEGLDPDLLENPDAPVPGGGPPPANNDDSDDEMSSASSFSDDD
ncbi:WASH complex subunit 3-like [Actinia tenebrosa]|uniref:WASH complex subunit 3 n=1 Tax=Actinia tenebrosa TaxID=6105 RepID=A0A6P8H8G9_ACTTE|nr:WASH complex subunit 3-like [Actinia tenebrosa]